MLSNSACSSESVPTYETPIEPRDSNRAALVNCPTSSSCQPMEVARPARASSPAQARRPVGQDAPTLAPAAAGGSGSRPVHHLSDLTRGALGCSPILAMSASGYGECRWVGHNTLGKLNHVTLAGPPVEALHPHQHQPQRSTCSSLQTCIGKLPPPLRA